MVLLFPFSYGFSLLCVFGSFFAISSCNWLGVWLGLEINLLGFIPLIVQGFGQDQVIARACASKGDWGRVTKPGDGEPDGEFLAQRGMTAHDGGTCGFHLLVGGFHDLGQ